MTEINGAKTPINFRKLLVSRCQQEFEQVHLLNLILLHFSDLTSLYLFIASNKLVDKPLML